MTFREKVKEIKRALSVLLERNSITELRVPKADGGPLTGLFDDFDALALAAAELSGNVPGTYVLLNQLKQSVARRVENRLRRATVAVKDADIERRRWLPIDFDPVRQPNTPSTDAEYEGAIALAKECRAWLRDRGWPNPVFGASGNGAHLLYPIDLPNDPASCELVKSALDVISLKFSSDQVLVDTGNFNASRVCRVYGTLNRKGKASDERPHRRAKLLGVPKEVETVSVGLLNELVATLPVIGNDRPKEKLDVARWIEENKVSVVREAGWKNGGCKWILQCPWNERHTNSSAFIVKFPNGGIAAGCLHRSCAGKDWPALRAHFEQRSGVAAQSEPVPSPAELSGVQRDKQTQILLEFGAELELFCTPQAEPYVTAQVRNHRENHPVKSRPFEHLLRFKYFSTTRTAPRPQAINAALAHFSAIAAFDSPRESVFVRVAAAGATNYLDLCNEQWQASEFDAAGWRIVETPRVKFRRTQGMLPLPTPVRGGDINELRKFLNLRTDEDWILFATALLRAMLPRGPYPALGLHGEAGSAKTTGSRIFRSLIDPNTSPARAMPKNPHDLMIMANNSWVMMFDNLSYLPAWFSDYLCRLSTGGGFATRQLYTDADEILFDGQRPIILNGVEELASRTDLIDRSILVDLPAIESYKAEREFWKEFTAAHPRLLGALLDAAVIALRKLPEVRLSEVPRMADFATFATAAEPGLGLSKGSFLKAYARNRLDANAIALEASPIARLVCDLVEERQWEGTAQDLLRKLSAMADDEVRERRSWPKTPRNLSGMLKRLATALRRARVEVEFSRENTAERTRKIMIKRKGTSASN